MLSAETINRTVSSALNEQSIPYQEEVGLEAKNDFSEWDALSHAVRTPLYVLRECVPGLQNFSKGLCKLKMPDPALRKNLFMPLRVLIVDDISMNRKILGRMLGKRYRCEFASNGQEAVEKYSENNFDLIFMDIQMPVMDGLEASIAIRQQELAQNKRRTPIIASTTLDSDTLDKGITTAAGMDGYLMKPYGEEQVQEIINLHTSKGEKVYSGSESHIDNSPTSIFPVRKLSEDVFRARSASSPELSMPATANSLAVSPRSGSSYQAMPAKNPELLSAALWNTPSDRRRLLARFHLLRHERKNNLAEDLLSGSNITLRSRPLRKSSL